MGWILFALFSVLEVAFAVWTCTKAREKKVWRKNRLILCAAQIVIAVIALLLPFGQKWRFVPVLGFLAVPPVIAGLIMLIKQNKKDGTKKPAGAIAFASPAIDTSKSSVVLAIAGSVLVIYILARFFSWLLDAAEAKKLSTELLSFQQLHKN